MGSNSLSSISSKQLSKVPSKTDKLEIEKPVYNGHGPSLIVDETNEILRKAHFTLPKLYFYIYIYIFIVCLLKRIQWFYARKSKRIMQN